MIHRRNHNGAGSGRLALAHSLIEHEDMQIGLIGVGLLGNALAQRFLSEGHTVLGFDLSPLRLTEMERLGGVPASSPDALAAACDRIVCSLPDSSVVASVLMPMQLREGTIVIDTTTGDPDQAVSLGEAMEARGVAYLDACIGGSSRQVRERDAIVLCGGDDAAYIACEPLLACFAWRSFHLGSCGSGTRMKLALNLVLGLNRAALAEGLAFAEALGLAPEAALAVFQAGPAYSRVMDTKGAKMTGRDFAPEARLSQHLKDVRLILQSGARRGAHLPLSTLHRQILELAEEAGFGDADNSAVIQAFRP